MDIDKFLFYDYNYRCINKTDVTVGYKFGVATKRLICHDTLKFEEAINTLTLQQDQMVISK